MIAAARGQGRRRPLAWTKVDRTRDNVESGHADVLGVEALPKVRPRVEQADPGSVAEGHPYDLALPSARFLRIVSAVPILRAARGRRPDGSCADKRAGTVGGAVE